MSGRLPVESIFDQTPHLFGDGPPDPIVYDASSRALRQRTVNFAAKRYVDMMFVSGLDRATADRHFRIRAAAVPGGLGGRPTGADLKDAPGIAHREGRFVIDTNAAERRATVTWTDLSFGDPLTGSAIARAGYGGILLGPHGAPRFEARPIARTDGDTGWNWPTGDAVDPPP